MKYQAIYADPPWREEMSGRYDRRKNQRPGHLSYPTMLVGEIKQLPVNEIACKGAHLWLWTTNQFLKQGFEVMKAWGFTYLAPITWVKPSGMGNYFVHRTQTILFGYKDKCIFEGERYIPTVLFAPFPKRHSEKPLEAYELIERVSSAPRIELFARNKRDGWDTWGNEVACDVDLFSPLLT